MPPDTPDNINIDNTDTVIIGAGPIGLELAVALKHAGVDYLHIEAGSIGSSIAWWAPGTRYFSSPERIAIAGVPIVSVDQSKATREQYLAYLRAIVLQFELQVRTYERVLNIERVGDGFTLETAPSTHGVGGPEEASRLGAADGCGPTRSTIHARRIVLAHGNLHRARRLDVPGEDLPHVSHFFQEPHQYFGRRVLIIGGKNSAVEAALRCYRCGADVSLSYRGETFDPKRVKYWLCPEIEWLIQKGRIGWFPNTVPVEIRPGSVRIAPVGKPAAAGRDIAADCVLALTGYTQDRTLFDQLGVAMEGSVQSPIVDQATMETPSSPGVYIAGTSLGGSQQGARVFIENSHVHVDRIVRAMTGNGVPWGVDADYGALEES